MSSFPSITRQKSICAVMREAGQYLNQEFSRKECSYTHPDIGAQRILVSALHQLFPGVPLLVEEQDDAFLKEFPNVNFLSAQDCMETLPGTYLSIDPLDGSAVFCNRCPEFGISVAYIEDHHPQYGAILMPQLGTVIESVRLHGCHLLGGRPVKFQASKPIGRSLIGLDMCKSVTDRDFNEIVKPLATVFRYPRNLPSVASGVELLLERTVAWVSTNARNWDIAAVALAVGEAGGVAQCLDGASIPWNKVKMPPLLFAASRDVASKVRAVLVSDRNRLEY